MTTHVNYELLRERVWQAVRASLPVDPDDTTCVVRFDGGTESLPVWGPPGQVVDQITVAVMCALFPDPVTIPSGLADQIDDRVPKKWGCGCLTDQCRLSWSESRTGGIDPTSTYRVVCISHGLHGDSMPGRQGEGMRLRAQALIALSEAHNQDCR